MNAKVVNSSVNKRRNFLTLNVGTDQGIKQDMAVMSSEGIVGIVTNVSANFSSVMSVLHKDVRVNCQLKKDGSYGPLIWDGKDYRYCLLTDIPTHAKIKSGDTVITSELSGIFPEGITVGTVESFERRQNEGFYTAKIKLSADLKKVNHVYVIKNKFKTERDSLETLTQKQIDD
jgi:rod shape-determining protein MreC